MSAQASQSDELKMRLNNFTVKDKRNHVVTLTDLCRSLELLITKPGGMSKPQYVQQIVAALLAELPAAASSDTAKEAYVDASLRDLVAFRDGLTGTSAVGKSGGGIQSQRPAF